MRDRGLSRNPWQARGTRRRRQQVGGTRAPGGLEARCLAVHDVHREVADRPRVRNVPRNGRTAGVVNLAVVWRAVLRLASYLEPPRDRARERHERDGEQCVARGGGRRLSGPRRCWRSAGCESPSGERSGVPSATSSTPPGASVRCVTKLRSCRRSLERHPTLSRTWTSEGFSCNSGDRPPQASCTPIPPRPRRGRAVCRSSRLRRPDYGKSLSLRRPARAAQVPAPHACPARALRSIRTSRRSSPRTTVERRYRG